MDEPRAARSSGGERLEELKPGWLKPVYEVIAELKALGPSDARLLRVVGGTDAGAKQ